jgi:hypothetical protein
VRELYELCLWQQERIVVNSLFILQLTLNLLELIHHYLIIFWNRLLKNANYWHISLGSNVVATANEWFRRHHFVRAKFDVRRNFTV